MLVALSLLTLASALGSWRYASIDSDLGKLIRPSDTLGWYRDNEVYKSAFPELQQTAVVVVSGSDGVRVDAAARSLAAAFEQHAEFEFVYAPTLDAFFLRERLYYLDPPDLRAWIEGVRYDSGVLRRLADHADLANAARTFADQVSATPGLPLQDPLASLARSFGQDPIRIDLEAYPRLQTASEARHHALIVLKGPQRLDESLPSAALVALIRGIVADTPVAEGVRVRLTGEIVLADEEIRAGLDGIGIAGTLSLVLMAIILGVGVRSLRTIVVMFVMLFAGVTLTLGFGTLAVGSFNTLSLIFVVMFFGLGVDFAVHFALRVRESGDLRDAEVAAARDIGPALLLCALTTVVGFLSFVPTAYRGLAELGIISSGGVLIALFLTLTLLPALFRLLGSPRAAAGTAGLRLGVEDLPAGPVLAATALVSVVALYFAVGLRFDYSVLAMRDATTEAMSTLLELQEDGVVTDYSISVLAPDAAAAAALPAALRALPEVGAVQTPLDLVPGDQAEKRALLEPVVELLDGIDGVEPGASADALPGALARLRQVEPDVAPAERPLYRMLVDGLSALEGRPAEVERLDEALRVALETELRELRERVAARPFGLDDLPPDLRARMVSDDGRQLLNVQPATPLVNREETERFIDAVAGVAPNIAGRSVVEWGVGEVAVRSFIEAVTLSIAVIFGLLMLYFRGVVRPLMVLLPIGLATLFSFALMEVTGLSLNMANILVVPLIFGLGVDTGIHVVHRFASAGDIHEVFESSTARAVLISALTTIGAFFSLSFSPHKGAASVGQLLFLAISLMLLATFVVLPAMLRLFGQRRSG